MKDFYFPLFALGMVENAPRVVGDPHHSLGDEPLASIWPGR